MGTLIGRMVRRHENVIKYCAASQRGAVWARRLCRATIWGARP